jgi:hypothetical protein
MGVSGLVSPEYAAEGFVPVRKLEVAVDDGSGESRGWCDGGLGLGSPPSTKPSIFKSLITASGRRVWCRTASLVMPERALSNKTKIRKVAVTRSSYACSVEGMEE